MKRIITVAFSIAVIVFVGARVPHTAAVIDQDGGGEAGYYGESTYYGEAGYYGEASYDGYNEASYDYNEGSYDYSQGGYQAGYTGDCHSGVPYDGSCPLAAMTWLDFSQLLNQAGRQVVEEHTAGCQSICGGSSRCDLVNTNTYVTWGDGGGGSSDGPSCGGLGTTNQHTYANGGPYDVTVEAIFERPRTNGGFERVTYADTKSITVPGGEQRTCNSQTGACEIGGDGASCQTASDCPQPAQNGSLHVESNVPSSWTISGPGCPNNCPGGGTSHRYDNKDYGTYTIHPGDVNGYITPGEQTDTLGPGHGDVWFLLSYSPSGGGGPQHLECQGSACVTVDGGGASTCTRDANCGPNPVHNVCQSNTCTQVTGTGTDLCAPAGGSCGTPTSHNICQGGACVSIAGAGTNECAPVQSPSSQCGPSCTFTADPARITIPPFNASSQLSWNCQNVTSCSIDQGIGGVGAQGTRSVTPTSTITYTLSCQGPGGGTTLTTQVGVTVRVFSTQGGVIKEVRP